MKLTDIHIRDPFIFAEDGTYYLYGTRANHPLGPRQGEGLDVYTSKDLVEWSEPYECFTTPKDFWADRDFFAGFANGNFVILAKGAAKIAATEKYCAGSFVATNGHRRFINTRASIICLRVLGAKLILALRKFCVAKVLWDLLCL